MKKLVSIFLALTMALGALTGCGNSASTNPSEAESSSKTPSQESSQTPAQNVEITAWFFPTFAQQDGVSGKYEQSIVEAFNKKNPNVKVNVEMIDFQNGPEKITTAIAGGTAPDVIFDAPGRIIEWGKAGNLASLDDMFTDDFKKDMSSKGLLNSCSDGKTYWMYPISAAPFTMALNKTILEKENLMSMAPSNEERTWTTEQFVALSKEFQKKGYKGAEVYCGGQGGDQGTRAFMANLFGATIMNDVRTEYTMNSEAGVKAMQMVVDGCKEGWLTPNTAGVANDALDHFDQGQVAATILWGPGLAKGRKENLKNSGIEAYAVSLPSPDGKPVLEYLINGFCVFDNKDADKIAASKELIKFICDDAEWGPKNVKATGCFPVRTSFGDLYAGDADMSFYSSLAKYYGNYYNTVDGFATMRPFWWGSMQAALTGEKSAKDAMEYFVKESNATLKG